MNPDNHAISPCVLGIPDSNNVHVDLFFIPLNDMPSSQVSLAQTWLSADELAKVARYRDFKAQIKGLQVRAALRAVLSHYADVSPNEWCFEYGAKGKPRLTAKLQQQTGLEFNLSHSGEWLLIGVLPTTPAIQRGNIRTEVVEFNTIAQSVFRLNTEFSQPLLGVDIERSRPKTDIYPILTHYFSAQETAALLALADESSQRQRFFDLWALKESYIKATGLGLAQSLKSFGFELKPFEELTVESLELRCQNSVLNQSCDVTQMLSVYSNIPFQRENKPDLQHWQSHFGRLTEEYRFAVSLGHTGHTAIPMKLTAQLSSIEALLADYG
ncbi:MAG: 4'-phosphopantetheinyl transferase family protein [Shewanella sp.]